MSVFLCFSAWLLITALNGNAMLYTPGLSERYLDPREKAIETKPVLNHRMTIDQHDKSLDTRENELDMDAVSAKISEALDKRTKSKITIGPGPYKNSYSWIGSSCVSAVKNQGRCNNSWAFAAVGNVESLHCIKTGKLVELSEQQLIDCGYLSSTEEFEKCAERSVIDAYFAIAQQRGITTEKEYPYKGQPGQCREGELQDTVKIQGYNVVEDDEAALLEAVKKQPVAVTIDASHHSFRDYTKGIYYEEKCSPDRPTHSMLLVGYGSNGKGKDYWIVKNSMGNKWGKKGYILMARNRDNNCGIASKASYPVLKN